MAHPDDEVIEIELVNCLGELGLTEYEARALVKLRRLGTATAKDIASADGIPRTQVYDAVETLHETGLVDIQHTTPRKYTVVSRESIIRKLNIDRENAISEAAELFEQLSPLETQREQAGVWTVTGRDAAAQRIFEFIDEADEQIVYMTVDDLLTDEQLAHLEDAAERDVEIHIAGISEDVRA
jgi:sugar-specific transcriptional regulator TrmB